MRPLFLSFEHFGSYRERQHIDFSTLDDFFLIFGKTGSGKSTIFDAISFALYGQALGGRSNLERELVSKFSPPASKPWVEFEFIASDARWRVYRSLPYKKLNRKGVESEAASEVSFARVHDSGEIEFLTDRLAEANAALLKLLKLSADEFSKIVLLPQGAFQEFLEMKTSDRVEILEKLFDVEIYDRVAERAHQRAIELDSSLRIQREEMERLKLELGEGPELRIGREEAETRNMDERISRATTELSNLRTEADRTRDRLAFWEEISRAWREFDEIERARTGFESREARLDAVKKLSELASDGQRFIDLYAEASAILGTAIESRTALAELEDERSAIEAEEKRLPEARGERDEAQKSIALLQRAVEAWSKKDVLERRRIDIAGKLEAVGAESARREAEIAALKKEIGELEAATEGEAATQERIRRSLAARDALARAAEGLEQIEKVEAEREKILRKILGTEDSLSSLESEIASSEQRRDSLEDHARHAIAGSLASSLRESEPCPVCGSTTHPHLAELPSAVPDEAVLRQARAEVETKKSRRAALLQSAENDRDRAEALSAERVTLTEKLVVAWRNYSEGIGVQLPDPGAEEWRAALGGAQSALEGQLRALKAEIDGCAAARALLAQRRILANQRERELSVVVRQKSEFDLARAEVEAHLASLAQNIGLDDPNPQLRVAKERSARLESEIDQIQDLAQRWRVAFSTATSEFEIHVASLKAKLEALERSLARFLSEAKASDVEQLLNRAGTSEQECALPGFKELSASGGAPSLVSTLDSLAPILVTNRGSLVSLLSSFAATDSTALELARRVTGSVWPQPRLRAEEQEIASFKESWTRARAAYGALERRALSLDANARASGSSVSGSNTGTGNQTLVPLACEQAADTGGSVTVPSSQTSMSGDQPIIFDFEAEARALSEAQITFESRIADIEASIGGLRDERAALSAAVEHARALIARRDELARGYSADADEFGKRDILDRLLSGSLNPKRKMPFKNYVLGLQFKEIAARASERLYRMSGGRYVVEADILSGGGNKKIGLELSVFDAWNGGSRPVGTLSGGEKFMLSISLALGLADSIQERAGANRIESLFIDEGFGSLDEESLSLAISVLDELRGDKKIAIISHVEELCNRIPSRIVVKKGVGGSRLECERG